MSKTTDMQLFEARDQQGRDIETILADAYAEAGNLAGVARALDRDPATILRWVRRLKLEARLVKVTGEEATA